MTPLAQEAWIQLAETYENAAARLEGAECVEMPCTQASWITAVSAFSPNRRGSRKVGK
jgi:hypothetical protein